MAKPTGKEMVMIMKEEENPIELAQKMDNFINNFTADIEGFIQALKEEDEALKVRFSTISLLWVKRLNTAYEGKWFDLRNEYSVKTCNQITKILGEDLINFYPEYKGDVDPYLGIELEFEESFVEKLSRTHRTLQQTFSGIVFNWLKEMKNSMKADFFVKVSQKIASEMEDDFAYTPMI